MNMSNIEETSQKIKQCGIIAIIRGDFSVDEMLRICTALMAGTVTVVEVTLNSPAVLDALPKLRSHFGDKLLVGAGTVRNLNGVHQSLDAGAQFLVSPNFDPASVSCSISKDVLHLPGVYTATEAQNAFAAGCRMIKLFPCDFGGPSYLKTLRAPLNDIDFVPTGGVSIENIKEYAQTGAVAVGIGGTLVMSRAQSDKDLIHRAQILREKWKQGKNESPTL
jgi:2-dehydro-3-deoxyphosphogluconate aldolase/(4S)-4-hydroxy-2-oxoglutarate aldolase